MADVFGTLPTNEDFMVEDSMDTQDAQDASGSANVTIKAKTTVQKNIIKSMFSTSNITSKASFSLVWKVMTITTLTLIHIHPLSFHRLGKQNFFNGLSIKTKKLSPHASKLAQFGMNSLLRFSSPSGYTSPPPRHRERNSTSNLVSLALSKTPHPPALWKKLGSIHTTEAWRFFDETENDYSPRDYNIAEELVDIRYNGHPCDRPKDIRARSFILEWKTKNREVPPELSGNNARPVF
ncbi:hypothetical protein K435DRAFT_812274 [Dendrothele bispora CBS 962.96]|uniref:Uncharacterized protein n=1 Tax=Dendrothele bispora (strain CBS 962.96) TaxID=1314807 RepID=A0A4S8KPT8_DENBC|nr:hypothetical protein K435DRAFT_812274 [Dendrothele bispora CBS 962.96]